MVNVDATEIQQLKAVAITLVLALIANSLFHIFGFYRIPKQKVVKEERFSAILILKALVIFLISSLIIIPSITSIWFMLNGWKIPDSLPLYIETWLHLIGVWLTLTLFTAFIFLLDPSTRRGVFGDSIGWVKNILLGCGTWLVAYPTVLFAGNFLSYCIYKFLGKEVVDQVVVEKLKLAAQYPVQYQIMVFTIILIVPFLEELFFRGFLQTWIRQNAGRFIAIAITSIIFSLFHYSSLQGVTNIQLIVSLFILSCYLGFLRERQQSIWASVGLHSFFNGMSILILHASTMN